MHPIGTQRGSLTRFIRIAGDHIDFAASKLGNLHCGSVDTTTSTDNEYTFTGAQITGRVVREDEPRKQLPKPEAKPEGGKPEAAKAASDAEFALEAKVEPKDKSKLEAKRV